MEARAAAFRSGRPQGYVNGRVMLLGEHAPYAADIQAGEDHGPPPWDELVAYPAELPRR